MTTRPRLSSWLLIAVPGLIWGSSFLFIAEGLEAVGPAGVTFLRILIGFLTLSLFPGARKAVSPAAWRNIALLGLVWMAFPLTMFPFAEQRVSSALTGMLNGANPLFTVLVTWMLTRTLPSRGIFTGLAVGLLGAVLMALPALGEGTSSAVGVGMILAALFSYGFALNLAAPLQQAHGALPVIWRAQAVALLLTAPLGIPDVMRAQWSPAPLLSLLALGVLGTGVAFVTMAYVAGKVGATRASSTAFLIPPVALILGVVVRHEVVAWLAVLGGVTCVAGAWLMNRAKRVPVAPEVIRPSGSGRIAAGVVALLFAANQLAAQQPVVSPAAVPSDIQAVWSLPRLAGPVQVDGRSDDQAWQAVSPLPMTVYLPTYGSDATERTDARVAYDDDALYVMIDAWESHPGGVRASSMVRDDDAPGDFINVMLDTFGDRQNAVTFSTTPGGQRNDWTISNDAQSDDALSPAWNGVWDLATRRGPDGWHAEFRIPFSTLRFATNGGRVEFGLSLNRLTAHLNERVTFPAIQPASPLALWKPSHWQRVMIEDIHPGHSLRVSPYALAGIEGSRAPDPAQSPWNRDDRFEAGGDIKVGLTPSLTLDLTANTDFAEAEVDDQRINLTRFPLFYPERRAFFVERAGVFEVRTGSTDLLFNSRRVGLTATGEPVRILGGARLVGRVGGWDLGVFDAQTGRNPSGVRENLGVVRLRRGVLNRHSWAGLMVTSWVTVDSSQAALAADADLNLGGDDYLGIAAVTLAGDVAAGASKGVLPRGAFRLQVLRRRNRGFWYRGAIATTGSRYTPALGYVERDDAIQPSAELGYGRVVSGAGHLLRASGTTALAYRNAEGSFEGSVTQATVALEQPGGTTWILTATRQEDDLTLGFEPTPKTTVPAGRYLAEFAQLTLKAPSGPKAVLGGSLRAGEYYDGTLYSLLISPEWRASAYLRVSGDLQFDRVSFSDRSEHEWSRLARLRVLASASSQLSLSAVIQVNSLADLATANLRLRYNPREGHDLWVVYGHNLNLDRNRMSPPAATTARSALMVKYSRSFGT